MQVRPHVLRLRRVVDPATDVEVRVGVEQVPCGDHPGEAIDLPPVLIDGGDLLDVLETEMILSPAGRELGPR